MARASAWNPSAAVVLAQRRERKTSRMGAVTIISRSRWQADVKELEPLTAQPFGGLAIHN